MTDSSAIPAVRLGSRKSAKFVRCYSKPELNVFRVEVELHSAILRKLHISTVDDLAKVEAAIYPKHMRFVELDWTHLRRYLLKRENGDLLFRNVLHRAASARRVARYLRRHGIPNVHRFYVPLPINRFIQNSLSRWATQFRRDLQ
jgi:hypothetical protein